MQDAPAVDGQTMNERLAFMSLGQDGLTRVRKIKPSIDRVMPAALDRFYERVMAQPELAKLFRDDAHMAGAKKAQGAHWATVFSGQLDEHYYANARRIGLAHSRIGLKPQWYIGGYALVLEDVIAAVLSDMWPKLGIGGRSSAEAAASVTALIKAVLIDMDVAISTYSDANDAERKTLTNAIGRGLAGLATKDLTARLGDDVPAAYDALRHDFNRAVSELEEALTGVRQFADTIDSAAREISIAADDLSRRTEHQAASLEETTAAFTEISHTVNQTAQGAKHARTLVADAKVEAEASGAVVRRAIEAMESIDSTSRQIDQITGVIDEIAFQTNLLALNAGVEAARAGDAGRGFAVVASEVRALAQRSSDAAKQIKQLISTSRTQVDRGVSLVGETRTALEKIITGVSEIAGTITDMASNAENQAAALREVSSAVGDMDDLTQKNAAMVEETTAATQTLAQQTEELLHSIGTFSLTRTPMSSSHSRPPVRQEVAKPKPASAAKPTSAPTVHQQRPASATRPAAPKPTRQPVARTHGSSALAVSTDAQGWEEF